MLKCLPKSIELRTVPALPKKVLSQGLVSGAPLLKTETALGILKLATNEGQEKIAFVTPDKFNTIRNYPWNRPNQAFYFYTLLPKDKPIGQSLQPKLDHEITDYIEGPNNDLDLYEPKNGVADRSDYLNGNNTLNSLRSYILIVVDDLPPVNAYVAYPYQGKWYYVDADDAISQKNFDLISLFLTMMAVPPTTQPLSPTISVN